jgi:hypothetical protein
LEKISHQTFEGISISIDNKFFEDCVIVDCVLEYSGSEVAFERTYLSRCRYVFLGAANSTLRMLEFADAMPARVDLWRESAKLIQ